MTQDEFSAYHDLTLARCFQLRETKGKEYARDADQFANFKRIAADLNLHPAQVCLIYLNKHIDSIKSYVAARGRGEWPESSEPIQGRIQDAVNYFFLLGGMLEEETWKRAEVPRQVYPQITEA